MSEKKEMATIYIFGKKYDVPAELTIMNAMLDLSLNVAVDVETVFAVLVLQFIVLREKTNYRLALHVLRKLKTICISLHFLSFLL